MLKSIIAASLCLTSVSVFAQGEGWPEVHDDMKPAARWWWLGSAVNKRDITLNMEEYACKGMGGLEITPIYGVQGNEFHDIEFLSPRWMEVYGHVVAEGERLGIDIDMNTGTGWPFGGPSVSIEDAAAKVIFEHYRLGKGETLDQLICPQDENQRAVARLCRLMAYSDGGRILDLTDRVVDCKLKWRAPSGEWHLIAVFSGRTFQQVKRAAPGGSGYVLNHFSRRAVDNYLDRFTRAFEENGARYPRSFFNDSYEVYEADWTDDLFEEFYRRRGYNLEEHLPEFLAQDRSDASSRIVADYRQTLAEILLDNFTLRWSDWAHSHGSLTRNQAHGSPGNLIDLYAAVDIPECESFGISDFSIDGLRTDSIRKLNDSDLSMLKYASSAAHVTGKPLVSSETFTWLTEHFRTSLSQCKPDLDLFFVSGVNHVFFHGTTYSPADALWPGWKFYASVDMSPTNSVWRDADAFLNYITRCQSFLRQGRPDNDFLLYFPVHDMWHEQDGRLLMFDIHKMQQRAPRFISAVDSILASGYDADYISDSLLLSVRAENGRLVTGGGTPYKAIVVPGARFMPIETLRHLLSLARGGATVVFMDRYVEDVPGYAGYVNRKAALDAIAREAFPTQDFLGTEVRSYGDGRIVTGTDYVLTLGACGFKPEEIKTKYGLQFIRRSHDDGHIYFISALQPNGVEAWVRLAAGEDYALIFDPLDGSVRSVRSRVTDGLTEFLLEIESGQSLIIKTFDSETSCADVWKSYERQHDMTIELRHGWTLSFVDSEPRIGGNFDLDGLGSWTDLGIENADCNMGTALYSTEIDLPTVSADDWELDLGDVRESARVRINGCEVAVLWAVPFKVKVGRYLREGKNRIEVEVTNLPANRIADYDRRGVDWRIFKEINFVNIFYTPVDYSGWGIMPSGLLGPVTLTPLTEK